MPLGRTGAMRAFELVMVVSTTPGASVFRHGSPDARSGQPPVTP